MDDIDKISQEMGVSTKAYLRMCETFITTTDIDLDNLYEAIGRGDIEKIAFLAHHIKGAALNLDLTDLSKIAKRVELNSKAGDIEGVSRDFERLKNKFEEEKKRLLSKNG